MTNNEAPSQSSWFSPLRRLLLWLNDLPIFNTEKWPAREWLPRLVGIALGGWFVFGKVSGFPAYLQRIGKMTDRLVAGGASPMAAQTAGALTVLSNALMILVFVAYVLSWATRVKAEKPARGFMEVVFPVLLAFLLPRYISNSPQTLSHWVAPDSTAFIALLIVDYALMVGGFAITLFAVLNMRTSFSIMTEARQLVRSGLFGWVRHPIYTGGFIMFLGALLLRLSPVSLLVYVALVAGHYYRARLEEKKLTEVYPEYEDYRRTTGMFFPRWNRLFAFATPARIEPVRPGEGPQSATLSQ